jgi:5-methylcytosine-specific restriction endonuclease McrA
MPQAQDIFRQIGMDLYGVKSTPKKRTSCPKAVKETVWRKYFGNKMSGKCYVCKKPILFTDFEVGHNKSFSKGGTWNVNNLRPICRTCNRSMGTMSIEAFKRKHFSIKRVVKRRKKGKKKAQPKGKYWVNPLTGKKELLFKY